MGDTEELREHIQELEETIRAQARTTMTLVTQRNYQAKRIAELERVLRKSTALLKLTHVSMDTVDVAVGLSLISQARAAIQNAERLLAEQQIQPCGHPLSAIVGSDEGTNYCGECAKDMK